MVLIIGYADSLVVSYGVPASIIQRHSREILNYLIIADVVTCKGKLIRRSTETVWSIATILGNVQQCNRQQLCEHASLV